MLTILMLTYVNINIMLTYVNYTTENFYDQTIHRGNILL